MNDAIGYVILGLVLVIIIILLVNSADRAASSSSAGRRPYGPYYQHGGRGYQPGVLY